MKLNIKNVGACLLLGGTLLTATSILQRFA